MCNTEEKKTSARRYHIEWKEKHHHSNTPGNQSGRHFAVKQKLLTFSVVYCAYFLFVQTWLSRLCHPSLLFFSSNV